ncbi:hypothetical protein SAMN02745119_01314 [Trichlorobacter thiogenes]|uniref:Lipoprotein n=1 Tax=Trichlorobacter thiogenes TaxID=115783 RepID=A0A1T4MIS2_9BACT|nr:hypothetical protein [Trichlorobacter thiogenes]SJZ66813.1 hypothetical protein SAMN02745119_01314 [Trichlorobacter thiogenes]
MQFWMKFGVVLIAALGISGCSSGNFMVYKDSKHFYVTSTGPELKRILCDTGDMDKIAKESQLPAPLQKDLKDGICNSNKVKERLLATLEGMTKEQRTALKTAFQQNGYDINVVANC